MVVAVASFAGGYGYDAMFMSSSEESKNVC
jgi:hypothetical protein